MDAMCSSRQGSESSLFFCLPSHMPSRPLGAQEVLSTYIPILGTKHPEDSLDLQSWLMLFDIIITVTLAGAHYIARSMCSHRGAQRAEQVGGYLSVMWGFYLQSLSNWTPFPLTLPLISFPDPWREDLVHVKKLRRLSHTRKTHIIYQKVDFPGGPAFRKLPASARNLVWFLVWKASTCLRGTKLVHHNYWAHVP